jgi:hypothetical protein
VRVPDYLTPPGGRVGICSQTRHVGFRIVSSSGSIELYTLYPDKRSADVLTRIAWHALPTFTQTRTPITPEASPTATPRTRLEPLNPAMNPANP